MEGIEASGAVRDVTIALQFTSLDECARSFTDRVAATVVMINLGDAVYRVNKLWSMGDKGHSCVVASFDAPFCGPGYLTDDVYFGIIEMGGTFAPHVLWSGLDTATSDAAYPCWGCYTVDPRPSYVDRLKILRVVKFFYACDPTPIYVPTVMRV